MIRAAEAVQREFVEASRFSAIDYTTKCGVVCGACASPVGCICVDGPFVNTQ